MGAGHAVEPSRRASHLQHSPLSAYFSNAKVPDGTFSWKWFKSLAQRSDLNLVGSTWSAK